MSTKSSSVALYGRAKPVDMRADIKDMTSGCIRVPAKRELTVGAMVVRALFDLAVAKGVNRHALAQRSRIRLEDLRDADNRIPFSCYVALMRAGQELCNDPALALHFGEAVDGSEISIAHAFGAVDNITEAIGQGNRYAPLGIEVEGDGSGNRFQLRREGGHLWLMDTRRNPNDFPELTESTFARMVCTARKLLGQRQVFEAVHMTHAEPPYRAEYDRIFGVPVMFGSKQNALRMDAAVVAGLQLPTSPTYVAGVLRMHADALLEKLESTQSTRERVETLLLPLLRDGDVSMRAVASSLCLSRQTLFRQLKTQGVTFEQVLNQLRHKLALNYLTVNKTSVKETARLVGYSDPAAFSRAFKRWAGSSPRAYVSRRTSSF